MEQHQILATSLRLQLGLGRFTSNAVENSGKTDLRAGRSIGQNGLNA